MIYLLLGVIIDLVIGDPAFIPHPVEIFGKLINKLEAFFTYFNFKRLGQIMSGILLVLIVLIITYFSFFMIIILFWKINFYLYFIIKIWFISTTLSIKGLAEAGEKVYSYLKADNLRKSRKEVAKIVGRDTESMEKEDIIKATVETIAENTSDGIIAPIFYYFVGGLPLAMTYKAVNTLDSMLGYKNEKYQYLGWAAARLDDLVNFIPARLTALAICGAGFLSRKNWKNGCKRIWKDADNHPSWNAGFPEAAMAGILGIKLGGLNYYQGEPEFRAYMGEKIKEIEINDIETSLKIMYISVVIVLLLLILI